MSERGLQFEFVGYSIASPDEESIFEPGDLGVIAAVDSEDGTFRCFGLDQNGNLIPTKGDTLFLEEMILKPDAARVRLDGDEE